MDKSKSGIKLLAFALAGYVFCYFGQYQVLILLLGFALLFEKNEWLTYQLLQAVILRLSYDVIGGAWSFIYNRLYDTFTLFEAKYDAMKSLSDTNNIITDIIFYAFLVLLIIGVVKLLKKKKYRIPFISSITDAALEFSLKK